VKFDSALLELLNRGRKTETVAYWLIDISRGTGSDQGFRHGLDIAYTTLKMYEFCGILQCWAPTSGDSLVGSFLPTWLLIFRKLV